MLVILVVLALLSATAVLKWSSVHHRAVGESAVNRLEFLDQHLRQFARSRGRGCQLSIDLQRSRVRKGYGDHEAKESAWESLGSGVRVAELRLGPDEPKESVVEIFFDRQGVSPTYGLHLAGPGQRNTWLLVAGVSGQLKQYDREADWNAAFQLLTPPGL